MMKKEKINVNIDTLSKKSGKGCKQKTLEEWSDGNFHTDSRSKPQVTHLIHFQLVDIRTRKPPPPPQNE
jgi:hypothetical protein